MLKYLGGSHILLKLLATYTNHARLCTAYISMIEFHLSEWIIYPIVTKAFITTVPLMMKIGRPTLNYIFSNEKYL